MIETKEYYDYYLKTRSMLKLAQNYKTCAKRVVKLFKNDGYEYPIRQHIHELDINYFDKIDSVDKAYVLGFIFADGCLYRRHRPGQGEELSLSFNIVEDDVEILEFIRSSMKSTHPITRKDPCKFIAPNGVEYTRRAQSSFCISSRAIGKSLFKYIDPRKIYSLKFPELDEWVIPHFIRGFFDGDGSVSFGFQNSKSCGFTIKNHDFAVCLQSILKQNNINFTLRYQEKKDVYSLSMSSYCEMNKFYNFIYCGGFYLKRKHLKFAPLLRN